MMVDENVDWENAKDISGPEVDVVVLRQIQRSKLQRDLQQHSKRQLQLLQLQAEADTVKRQQAKHDRMRGSSDDKTASEEENKLIIGNGKPQKVEHDEERDIFFTVPDNKGTRKESGESLQTVLAVSDCSSRGEISINDQSETSPPHPSPTQEQQPPCLSATQQYQDKHHNQHHHCPDPTQRSASFSTAEVIGKGNAPEKSTMNRVVIGEHTEKENYLDDINNKSDKDSEIRALKTELKEARERHEAEARALMAAATEAGRQARRVAISSALSAKSSKDELRRLKTKIRARNEDTVEEEEEEEDERDATKRRKEQQRSRRYLVRNREYANDQPPSSASTVSSLRKSAISPSKESAMKKSSEREKDNNFSGLTSWLKNRKSATSTPSDSKKSKSVSTRGPISTPSYSRDVVKGSKSADDAGSYSPTSSKKMMKKAAPHRKDGKHGCKSPVPMRRRRGSGDGNAAESSSRRRGSVASSNFEGESEMMIKRGKAAAMTKLTTSAKSSAESSKERKRGGGETLAPSSWSGKYGMKKVHGGTNSTGQAGRTIVLGDMVPDGLLLCNPSPAPSVMTDSKTEAEVGGDIDGEHRRPSSTAEWVEAASSNLKLKAEMAEKVFETAEKLAEVAETRTRELNSLEVAFKRVSKELECYKLFEVKLRDEGILQERAIRELKWSVVNAMKGQSKSIRDNEAKCSSHQGTQ